MKLMRAIRPICIAVTLICLTACGSSAAGQATSAAPPKTGGTELIIKSYSYTVPSSVKPGQKVTIRNNDDVAHTVTAKPGHAFDVKVPASGTAVLTAPSKPGSYPFICTYHPYMHGTLKVS